MRIVGLSLGLLLLGFAGPHSCVAQSTPQVTAAPPASTSQVTDQQSTAAKKNKDDDASSHDRKLHFRLGTISIGAGYSYFSGPAYYPYAPYYPLGWEYASLWSPYWGPYSFFGPDDFRYGSDKGEVRLAAEPKSASVYLDNAYAGTADHLKSMWLEPGAYSLSVDATGRESYHQRIYVLSGKTLKISARLAAVGTAGETPESKDKP